MTELEKLGLTAMFIILILTIWWAAMMIHQDLTGIWRNQSEIKELLKKLPKE